MAEIELSEILSKGLFEKVLFPTDFSEYAEKTLDCIGEIPSTKEVVLLQQN